MRYKINADPKRIIGKRPNLSEQNSVADEIVTALSSQQEQPIVPLSSTTTGKPSPWGKIYVILAAALLFATAEATGIFLQARGLLIPNWILQSVPYVLTLLILWLGVHVFRKYSAKFAEVLS